MTLYQRLNTHAIQYPDKVAIEWPGGRLCYSVLLEQVARAEAILSRSGVKILAVDLENGPDWVAFDVASLKLGICSIPLPPFFSASQLAHVLATSRAGGVLTDNPEHLRQRAGKLLAANATPIYVGGRILYWIKTRLAGTTAGSAIPESIRKITFTSGTTGEPKGVMLSWAQMKPVVQSLSIAVSIGMRDRHLALMPLSILLENIAGLYAPLWAGATVVLRPASQVGLRGSAAVDGTKMLDSLSQARATAAIFTPQMLQGTIEALEARPDTAIHLKFAAVGGAPVSHRLLDRAVSVGLPVFEGYGLSECASVVCLNTPGANRPGSVGKPLPHVRLMVSDTSEITVSGQTFGGYLGDKRINQNSWPTGDLGTLDEEGYLYLHGRRRNVFITAFGRNVAPEWVERELTVEPAIAQAFVFGESRAYNVAILVTASETTAEEIETAVARTNQTLPDYARITRWFVADEPFSLANGELTGTGRLRRPALLARYADRIESLYNEAQTS